jgi:hypothetical protein
MTTANRRLFVLCLMALLGAAPGLAQDALPLAERRALKAYQDDVYPGQIAAIRQAAGFELPVDVKWEAVARPGQADRFAREGHFTKVYFTPLTEALKGVASDQMGRDALKARLKQVVITYDKATAPISNYPNGLTFADGVLTINFEPGVNENDVKDRTRAIRDLLESKL